MLTQVSPRSSSSPPSPSPSPFTKSSQAGLLHLSMMFADIRGLDPRLLRKSHRFLSLFSSARLQRRTLSTTMAPILKSPFLWPSNIRSMMLLKAGLSFFQFYYKHWVTSLVSPFSSFVFTLPLKVFLFRVLIANLIQF